MKTTARLISLITCCAMLVSAAPAFADDNAFRDIFEDAFYGGAAGVLVGAACWPSPGNRPITWITWAMGLLPVFWSDPSMAWSNRPDSLAQIDNGIVRFAMPTVYPISAILRPRARQTSPGGPRCCEGHSGNIPSTPRHGGLIPIPNQSGIFVGSSSAPQRTTCTPSSPRSSPP